MTTALMHDDVRLAMISPTNLSFEEQKAAKM